MSAAIVPAAGHSRRMGRPKLGLPFRGGTVLGALLATLDAAGCRPLVVVTRAGQTLPEDARRARGLLTAVNPIPERGMLSSILAGLEALGGVSAPALAGRPLLICPADHPAVGAGTVRALLRLAVSPATLAVPSHEGRRGHPLAVSADLVAEIPRLDPAVGLRQLLVRWPEAVRELPVDDAGVLADLDTVADYERLTAGF